MQLKNLPHHVVVATDHSDIFNHVVNAGFEAVMTSSDHLNGTSRCIECAEILKNQGLEFDVLINVQGDEPLINPHQILEISKPFDQFEEMNIATLCRKTDSLKDIQNPNVVKVVKGNSLNGFPKALYFSRSPIPYSRDKSQDAPPISFKHVGIYAFRIPFLSDLKAMKVGSLEQTEKLEQLRWLEHGHEIGIFETEFENIGVDTPEDIEAVENFLKNTPK